MWPRRYDGFTEARIREIDPRFSDERRGDKLGMRYPKGESYLDLITRLEPLVHELLSYEEPLLIISHQACVFCHPTLNELPPMCCHPTHELPPMCCHPTNDLSLL